MSAHWDTDGNKLFLELCVEEIRKVKKSPKSLNIAAWENIRKKFHEITGKEYTQKQFRNHWDTLKNDWKLYQTLKRMASGVGWKEASGTISASEPWWSDKIQKDKRYDKFKYKGLEHYDLMEELFGGTAATGDHAYTPNSGLPHPSIVSKKAAESQIGDPDIEENFVSEDQTLPTNDQATSGRSGNMTKGVKRRKQAKDNAMSSMNNSIDRLISVFESTSASSCMQQRKNDIEAAISVLKNLPGVARRSQMQMFGARKMADAPWREVFMALKDEDLQLSFLKSEWE